MSLTYFTDVDYSEWTQIGSLEERFSAIDVKSDTAASMTTDAIVQSILHYPLNYLIFAYDDPLEAVNLVLKYSSIHRELLRRDDAAEVLLYYFMKTEIATAKTNTTEDNSVLGVTYSDEMFLDYLIASERISGFKNPVLKEKLIGVVNKKYRERSKDTNKFSQYSMIPLDAIRHGMSSVYAPKVLLSFTPISGRPLVWKSLVNFPHGK